MRLAYDPAQMRRITDARDFGRVAVLFGGTSAEREISLKSGAAVLEALRQRGVDAHPFDPRDIELGELARRGFARVWNALLGSALGMDKLRTKRLAAAVGVQSAESVVLRGVADCDLALERLGLPLIVKPATQGSSVGMSKVTRAEEMPGAYGAAAAVDDVVFAEAWITGAEYTVAVLHRRVLPAIRIETQKTFYDYEAKYLRNDTKYHCPAGLSAPAEAHLASLALAAFDAVGASGWGRVDFMADQAGRPLMLELNTVPGMTDHSLVPMAARAAGIDFGELCWQVLETSFARRKLVAGEAA
jgi:D-alanine-D-alanine ligase